MDKTPVELQLIGNSDVYAVRFTEDTLIHLDYNGDLVTFLYSETGMTEVARVGLAPLRKQAVLQGSTLWYTTHNDGVYSYNISNPSDPHLLSHLAIEGYLGPIAVSDSRVVVSTYGDQSGIEIHVIGPDNSWTVKTSRGSVYAESLEIRDRFLIIFGRGERAITILSLDDPGNVEEVYSWGNPYFWRAFPYGDSIIFVPRVELYYERFSHAVLDISDPTTPVWQTHLSSQVQLDGLLNDTLSVGLYNDQPACLANIGEWGFRVVALALSSWDLPWLPDIDQQLTKSAASLEETQWPGILNPPQMVGDFVLLDTRLWRIVRE
jgi:hypothetical protein